MADSLSAHMAASPGLLSVEQRGVGGGRGGTQGVQISGVGLRKPSIPPERSNALQRSAVWVS